MNVLCDFLIPRFNINNKKELVMKTRMKKGFTYLWNKETIQDLLDKNDLAVYRVLVQIYNRQTEYEKHAETTTEYNGVGFNGIDGEFLTSLAKQYLNRGILSPKQFRYARTKLKKYWKQLQQIAIENGKNLIVPKLQIGQSWDKIFKSERLTNLATY